MTLVVMCDICNRPYRACDLSHVQVDPPHYEELPEPNAQNHVDIVDEDRPEDRVITLWYCERCLDAVELPPLQVESDPEIAPKEHHPDTEHDGPEPRTDGGQVERPPEIYDVVPLPDAERPRTCQLWTGEDPEPCDNEASHIFVYEASFDPEDDGRRNSLCCPECKPQTVDSHREGEPMADGGTDTLGVPCDVQSCEETVVGLDDGYEFRRGTVCNDCVEYHDRHGHWPDEDVEICVECRIDQGKMRHDCEEAWSDSIIMEPGTECDVCGEVVSDD